ncbi:hypothetical protein KBY82_03115 [Cyanobium sp. AMD-g]|uniref:hypothetical protein n=1 Tax=Cyanobium sp. AMD-g TaxID=2823699 RepID=UPI0020CFA824|nr:hypothetical protein [Cyanobium sp. AMD-g]MCP9929769.1 hypothetical protein [Cyanobium sp. AMD-g]
MSVDPFELVIHDDGSLTDHDRYSLAAELPGSRILDRQQADATMAEKLRPYANARAFREASVWGLKLLDVVLAEPGLCFYLDSDISFLRPFEGLFVEEATAGRCVFLRDTVWHAYSIRPWHLMDRRGLKVASGINTGLTLCDPQVFDLAFVDWFLGQMDWRVIPAWTEPTCWAALALRAFGHAVDPSQVTNLYPSAQVTDQTLGAHFLSSYRSQWKSLLVQPVRNGSAQSTKLRFVPLKPLTAAELALNQCQRKLQNTILRTFSRP